ncbi:MAG: diaminopimelate decarboxylase [Deltaproteobacteria bacterium]|nr:diaminopimelate decarboxylase [Deltaproteobacteria bacterium]
MNHFQYRNGELSCEEVPLARIADEVGTPTYVYSRATMERHFHAFDGAFAGTPHVTCFAMKANSNLEVLRLFAALGSGADIVSGGELYRARKAGVPADKIVYSGVGKTEDEIAYALSEGILMFNVESEDELRAIDRVAARVGKRAPISIRVNPDVDPKTHPYIATGLKKSKFGVAYGEARRVYRVARGLTHLDVVGLDCHIGSQLTEVDPFLAAAKRLRALLAELAADGHRIRYLDLGGGLGIPYKDEEPPHPSEYAARLLKELGDLGLMLVFEPGRVIVGNAGVLLTRVLYNKRGEAKRFIICDGAMNDLIRPSLYKSYHEVRAIREALVSAPRSVADLVGPVCESGDFLAQDRELPEFAAGDLIAMMSAGAYGFVMSSNYNARPRPAEVLVSGASYEIVRTRETFEDLIRGEVK